MMYKGILGLLLFVQILTGTASGHSEKQGRLLLQQSDAQGLNATFQTTLPQADCTQFLAFDNIQEFLNEWNVIFACEGCTLVAGFLCENSPVFTVTVEPPSNAVTTEFFQSVINTAVLQPSCILDQNVSSYADASVTVQSASQQLQVPSNTDSGLTLIEGCVLPPPPPPTEDDGALDLRFDFSFTAQNPPPPPLPILLSQADAPVSENFDSSLPSSTQSQQNETLSQQSEPIAEDNLAASIEITEPEQEDDFSESQQLNLIQQLQEADLLILTTPALSQFQKFSPMVEFDDDVDLEDGKIPNQQDIVPLSDEDLADNFSTTPVQLVRDIDGLDKSENIIGEIPQIEEQQIITQLGEQQNMEIILSDEQTQPQQPPITETPPITDDLDSLEEEVDDTFDLKVLDAEPTVESQQELDQEIILTDPLTEFYFPPSTEITQAQIINDFDNLEEVDDIKEDEPTVESQEEIRYLQENDIEMAQTPIIDNFGSLDEVDDMIALKTNQLQIPEMEEDQKESDIEEAQTPMGDDVSSLEEDDDVVVLGLQDSEPMSESKELKVPPQVEADLDENELQEVAPEIEKVPSFSRVMENKLEELEPELEEVVTQESNEGDLNESQGDAEVPMQEFGSTFFPMLQEDLVYADTFPSVEQLPEPVVERLMPAAEEVAVISGAKISETLTADNLQSLFAILLGVQNG